jgi:hypothetical protein
MSSTLYQAAQRARIAAQTVHDISKSQMLTQEDLQALSASVVQLANCVIVLAAAGETRIDDPLRDADALPPTYAEAVRQALQKVQELETGPVRKEES